MNNIRLLDASFVSPRMCWAHRSRSRRGESCTPATCWVVANATDTRARVSTIERSVQELLERSRALPNPDEWLAPILAVVDSVASIQGQLINPFASLNEESE